MNNRKIQKYNMYSTVHVKICKIKLYFRSIDYSERMKIVQNTPAYNI